MSTRCQIGFYHPDNDNLKKPNALIYQHCDGYPDSEHGVIHALLPFLKEFHKERGLDDTEYAAAWCLHHLMPPMRPNLSYTGYGICEEFHDDIAYYYAIRYNEGWKLEVYDRKFALVQTLDI